MLKINGKIAIFVAHFGYVIPKGRKLLINADQFFRELCDKFINH